MDVLAVGELLVDFISEKIENDLGNAKTFFRLQGGSPANLAANLARLGLKSSILSSVGKDSMGRFLIEEVKKTGADTSNIKQLEHLSSSMALVGRTQGTPDFIPIRLADAEIEESDLNLNLLEQYKIIHVTCWPLSRNPAQSTILTAVEKSHYLPIKWSIDLNYAEKVWPNKKEAQEVVRRFFACRPLLKLSEDDASRFLGSNLEPQEIFEIFHGWGAEIICYTRGEKGSIISSNNGKDKIEISAVKVSVKDATGAGDAFWSGFLAAYLKNLSLESCGIAGSKMAALKLESIGPLPAKVSPHKIGIA